MNYELRSIADPAPSPAPAWVGNLFPCFPRNPCQKDNLLLGGEMLRYGIKNDTKVKKMAKMFAHYQKLCNFATELKEKTSEMNKSVFAAWWWRYSRLEQS